MRGALTTVLLLAAVAGCSDRGFVPGDEPDIYSAAVRSLLVERPNPPGPTIYFLDYPVDGVGYSPQSGQPGGSFGKAVREAVEQELSPIAPVHWVANRDEAIDTEGWLRVIDGGVLVTLGTITEEGTSIKVGVDAYWNPLGGGGWIYTLKYRADSWAVTEQQQTYIR